MKIIILSNVKGFLDEGHKNVAYQISNQLSKRHTIYHLNTKENIYSKNFWISLRQFNPHIIHIFLRPNATTFLCAKLLTFFCKRSKILVSALQPPLKLFLVKLFLPILKVDKVLTLSDETDKLFNTLGYKTAFLPCGVDTEKFIPVLKEKKFSLRHKYAIAKEKYIILHVGSINYGRNLLDLLRFQTGSNQVLIISNTTFNANKKILTYLNNNGCIIFQKYFENIEEFYQLADCYIFPTTDPSFSIEMPLSVLEAMACNLPVITTQFGAIPRVFTSDNGLFFVENLDSVPGILNKIRNKKISIKTRTKVLDLDWKNIAHNLELIFESLVAEK